MGLCQDYMLMSCRYFRLYLKKVAPTQDLEISVQCDVAVFSWLLQYTKAAAARRQPPVLTISNCMPVLIASHFLQVSHQVPMLGLHAPSAKACTLPQALQLSRLLLLLSQPECPSPAAQVTQ